MKIICQRVKYFYKKVFLLFLLPFSINILAADLNGQWSGSWEGVRPFTFEIQSLDKDQLNVIYSQPEAEQFGMKERVFSFTSNSKAFQFNGTEEQVLYSFKYENKQDVIIGEAKYPSFTLSVIIRREGDTRVYTPELSSFETPPAATIKDLPSAARWISHIKNELMPYWFAPDALGAPIGNFPTYLCQDATKLKETTPKCANVEFNDIFSENLNRQYVRVISRQVFAYGVMFHVTGDEQALQYAKAGVDYIRQYALDRKSGSVVTYWDNGVADKDKALRTSQDIAYAQMGLAIYYYLTRDEEVLADLILIKNYIFENYLDNDFGMMRWSLSGNEQGKRDLTAQLDQINAYLLMLVGVLPTEVAKQWKLDIRNLIDIMRAHFYQPKFKMFWGTAVTKNQMNIGANNDFGHSVKTFWMIYLFAKFEQDKELETFAINGINQVLKYAYFAKSEEHPAHWASKFNAIGKRQKGTQWWIFAELDQAAATLALSDASKIDYLAATYDTWLNLLTDRNNYEVWGYTSPKGEVGGLKSHIWKNGFHSLEHGLIAYITTAQLNGNNVELYFAFEKGNETAVPYLFIGKEVAREVSQFEGSSTLKKSLKRVKVSFDDVDK